MVSTLLQLLLPLAAIQPTRRSLAASPPMPACGCGTAAGPRSARPPLISANLEALNSQLRWRWGPEESFHAVACGETILEGRIAVSCRLKVGTSIQFQ